MRLGSVLIREHKRDGDDGEYYLLPGGKIDSRLAEILKSHAQVTANEDGVWPGYSQTWRM